MREYLFRGFLKEKDGPEKIILNGKELQGRWVEGDLVRIKGEKKTAWYIYGKGEVVPATVCAYTGLKDRTGRRIFERDILRFYDEESGGVDSVVSWETLHCRYIAEELERGAWDELDDFFCERSEVIGTAYFGSTGR